MLFQPRRSCRGQYLELLTTEDIYPQLQGQLGKGKKALQRKGGLICPELPQGRMGVTGLGISRKFTDQAAPSTKKFQRQKEEILQRLKQEAAMNVMRDKLTA